MKWFGVFISYPSWEERQEFPTKEQAEQWWKGKVAMSHRTDDWGYSYAEDENGRTMTEAEIDAVTRHVATQNRADV